MNYPKEFIWYASSNVLAMLGLSCYILADTFFIAQGLGEKGISALNLALPIFSLMIGLCILISVGSSTLYKILISRQDQKAQEVFTLAFVLSVVLSILLMLLGLFFAENLARVMGSTPELLKDTSTYIRVALLFSPAFFMNILFQAFFRNDNRPGRVMTASLLGSFSNIILDYIFIFPLNMGMFGAVFATGVSPVVSLLVLSPLIFSKKRSFKLSLKDLSLKLLPQGLKLGVPSFVMELSSGLVIMVFNMILLGLVGSVGVAAYGVIANVSLVILALFNGIAQGMQPISSQAYGLGDREGGLSLLRFAIKVTLIFSLVVYLTVFIFKGAISNQFNPENNLLFRSISVEGLGIYFIGMIPAGLNILLSMYFTSISKARPSQVMTFLRGILLIIPLAFLLSRLFGVLGVWISFPLTELLVLIIGLFFYRREVRDLA